VDGCGLSVDLSSDGSRYAVVTSRPLAGATVYDTASGRQVVAVTHPPGQRGSVRFSPDDRSIVTTGADGAARVWDVTTGEQAVALAGDGGEVLEAAWSPDGAQVVTSHLDGVVRVWSVEDGRLRSEIGEYSRAPSIALSPDGRRLATSADGVVHLWTTDTKELLELAAAKVTRSLTEGECERYGIDPCPTA
jgi:WD40 repeat protein